MTTLHDYQKSLCLMDRDHIEEKLQDLFPKKYNRFQWWRRYHDRQELDEKAPILFKILNGDYDYPSYFYQAQHEVYLMFDELKKVKHSEDIVDRMNLYMERYRRLMEDSEKEENKRFKALKKRLMVQFKLSEDTLEQIMESFEGSVEELYLYLLKQHQEKNNIKVTR